MPGRSGANHRKPLGQNGDDRTPHARCLGVAVQQDQRRTVPGRQVVQLHAADILRQRGDALVGPVRARGRERRQDAREGETKETRWDSRHTKPPRKAAERPGVYRGARREKGRAEEPWRAFSASSHGLDALTEHLGRHQRDAVFGHVETAAVLRRVDPDLHAVLDLAAPVDDDAL